MQTITHNGSVSKTGILECNRKKLQVDLLKFAGQMVEIIIRKKNTRGSQQNRYYHGVVVQEVRFGLIEIGYPMTNDETHEFLKLKFNNTQIVNKYGEVLDVPKSTTELNTVEFSDYIERIAQFASEYLGVCIPTPNTDLTFKF